MRFMTLILSRSLNFSLPHSALLVMLTWGLGCGGGRSEDSLNGGDSKPTAINTFQLVQCRYQAEEIDFPRFQLNLIEAKQLALVREFPFQYQGPVEKKNGESYAPFYGCLVAELTKNNAEFQTTLRYKQLDESSDRPCQDLTDLVLTSIVADHKSTQNPETEVPDSGLPYPYALADRSFNLRQDFFLVRDSSVEPAQACQAFSEAQNSQK